MSILVTGAAGFIGYHLISELVKNGEKVIGIDNLNDYYDVQLKIDRLKKLGIFVSDTEKDNYYRSRKPGMDFQFKILDLCDDVGLKKLFNEFNITSVVNLAAQAGVRYSIENPKAYIQSNIVGFSNLIELAKLSKVQHYVYASSSSVYGLNSRIPFRVTDSVDHPISLYAATKKSNELIAHTYSHLFDMPSTGLRFFTVYGPWGRPDMAAFIFANKITKGEPIQIFNYGNMKRDFTYIDDIVDGVIKVLESPPKLTDIKEVQDLKPSISSAPYKIYNIGNNSPVDLMEFLNVLELEIGKKAIVQKMPIQPGDVESTFADVSGLEKDFSYKPTTSIQDGLKKFVTWYKEYYKI